MNSTEAKLILDAKAILGEGAIWNPADNKLYWIDIEGRRLHIYDPENDDDTALDVAERIGTVVPAAQGGVLVALQNGIHHLDIRTGKRTFVSNPIEQADIRFNDGKCDPAGRFWVGTMALDARQGAAMLYCLGTDGSVKQVLDKLTISNGIGWAADGKTMYFTDTPTQEIKAFDYDEQTGNIENERTVISIPKEEGAPDGFTMDADGNIWAALHGGGAVVCYNPVTGEALQKIKVACPQTTSCAFGGTDLDTLYITTAKQGLKKEQLKEYPYSGGVFAVKPGVKGVAANFYKGNVYT